MKIKAFSAATLDYDQKIDPNNEQVYYVNPHTGRNTCVELWANPLGHFTIRTGANSDYSYTGLLKGITDMEHMKRAIKEHHSKGELFK